MTKREDDVRLNHPDIDRSMTGLEALADEWGVEINLPEIVKARWLPAKAPLTARE